MHPYLLGDVPQSIDNFSVPLGLSSLTQFVPKSIVILDTSAIAFLVTEHFPGEESVFNFAAESKISEDILKFSEIVSHNQQFGLSGVMFSL